MRVMCTSASDDSLDRTVRTAAPRNANENRRTRDHGHFRVAHLVLLTVGQRDPKRPEWPGAKQLQNVVRPHRLPPRNRNAGCTIPVRGRRQGHEERVSGIEPEITAWEAVVLPLHYTRFNLLQHL